MTKRDLIEKVSAELGLTLKDATVQVEVLVDILKDALSAGQAVKISGFGKWGVLDKHERPGRNPATGEEITIGARKVISFKASPSLRVAVNGG